VIVIVAAILVIAAVVVTLILKHKKDNDLWADDDFDEFDDYDEFDDFDDKDIQVEREYVSLKRAETEVKEEEPKAEETV